MSPEAEDLWRMSEEYVTRSVHLVDAYPHKLPSSMEEELRTRFLFPFIQQDMLAHLVRLRQTWRLVMQLADQPQNPGVLESHKRRAEELGKSVEIWMQAPSFDPRQNFTGVQDEILRKHYLFAEQK
jgi:hypothetical protein